MVSKIAQHIKLYMPENEKVFEIALIKLDQKNEDNLRSADVIEQSSTLHEAGVNRFSKLSYLQLMIGVKIRGSESEFKKIKMPKIRLGVEDFIKLLK